MPRQSWRKKVRIIKPNGKIVRDTREFGEYLLESGLAEPVPEERRFTIRLIDTSNYKEELTYSSGRPLKTVHNPTRPGTFLPGGKRCKPPRQKVSKDEEEFQKYKSTYGEAEEAKRCA